MQFVVDGAALLRRDGAFELDWGDRRPPSPVPDAPIVVRPRPVYTPVYVPPQQTDEEGEQTLAEPRLCHPSRGPKSWSLPGVEAPVGPMGINLERFRLIGESGTAPTRHAGRRGPDCGDRSRRANLGVGSRR